MLEIEHKGGMLWYANGVTADAVAWSVGIAADEHGLPGSVAVLVRSGWIRSDGEPVVRVPGGPGVVERCRMVAEEMLMAAGVVL